MDRRIVMALAVVVALGACTAEAEGNPPAVTTDADPPSTPTLGSIVFNRWTPSADPAVFTVDDDGSDERQIRAIGDVAILSPDGSRFMDLTAAPDGRITTSIFNVDGSGYSVLPIPDPTLQLGYGRWSPDGDRIVVEAWDDSDASRDGVYARRSSDGDYLRRLTDPGNRHDFPVGYSPDGSSVLFFRTKVASPDDESPMDLMSVDIDGTGVVRLNPPGTSSGLSSNPIIASASWSPDGGHVAFVASKGPFWEDSRHRAVFVAKADGTNARRITPWNCSLNAMWSPDGRWIAFDMCESEGPHDLHVVHPDGTELRPITSSDDGRFSFAPVWSPDSTKLLFVRSSEGFDRTDLWTVNVDGTALARVTHSPAEHGGYAWVP
jgi:Tol biopolymer transport system component